MTPQQPQFRLIRSSRLPMRPVTPEGPGRRCVKVCAVTKKKLFDGIGTTDRTGVVKDLPTDNRREGICTLVGGNDMVCRAPVRWQRLDVSSPCTYKRPT